MSPVLARLDGIVKRFGSVTALAGADLEVRAGEVHGVLGENGAGKTTLLSILGGLLRPDAGAIELEGEPVVLEGPREARDLGIALVHQHFTLVPALTVLENLALGGSGGGTRLRVPWDRIRREAERLMERTGLVVPLDAPAAALGVGERQRVETLKALLREPRLLVLDEPTAVLAPSEVRGLFRLLRSLAGEGRAVVLVAHKLDEVLAVADRVSVLRDGRSVLSAPAGEVDASELVAAMVGGAGVDDPTAVGWSAREARAAGPRFAARAGSGTRVARIRDVRVRGRDGRWALDGAGLEVARGEIVGIAGVEGNGQRELALVLAGRLRPDDGSVELPEAIGFVPQDRQREGLVGSMDLAENVALALQHEPAFRRGPLLRWPAIRRRAAELCAEYGVRAPDTRTRARALSGGNQQRVVVARELSVARDMLVAESPTRGLDVAATSFVHHRLRGLARSGPEAPGIVLVSTDLDEVLGLSDRIFAMVAGRLHAVPEGRRTREGVGALMLRRDRGDDEVA